MSMKNSWSHCTVRKGDSLYMQKEKEKSSKKTTDILLTMNVVSSFIESNRPGKIALVLAILMSETSFLISFYDSENDVLLLSKPISMKKDEKYLFGKKQFDCLIFCITSEFITNMMFIHR